MERVIGSIRRECLDHVIVFGEASLRRTLSCVLLLLSANETASFLDKDAPESRPIRRPELGPVVAMSQLDGLHHRYERRAA